MKHAPSSRRCGLVLCWALLAGPLRAGDPADVAPPVAPALPASLLPAELRRAAPNRGSLPRAPDPDTDDAPPYLPEWRDNLRVALDVAVNGRVNRNRGDDWSEAFLGIDSHKVFSGPDGDWGTAVVQLYLSRFDDHPAPPFFFDDGHDTELIPRIVTFQYTGLGSGMTNVKVGHIEMPFGLEHDLDTNGTLRQVAIMPTLGVKTDWGLTVNGEDEELHYEVALTRGSGVPYRSDGEPYLLTGRVGTPAHENVVWGLSSMTGRVRNPGVVALWNSGAVAPVNVLVVDRILRRKRSAVDFSWYHGLWAVMSQLTVGDDDGQSVREAFVDVSWRNGRETLVPYVQAHYRQRDFDTVGWDDALTLTLGIDWRPPQTWSWGAQFVQHLDTFQRAREDAQFVLQARRRF